MDQTTAKAQDGGTCSKSMTNTWIEGRRAPLAHKIDGEFAWQRAGEVDHMTEQSALALRSVMRTWPADSGS